MSKPIKDTFWTRLWWLVRGVLFYNTVYWKRASDEARPPRISQRERQEMMPVRDFNYIKPRAMPRAKLESDPLVVEEDTLPVQLPASVVPAPRLVPSVPFVPAASAPPEEASTEPVKKRRYSYHRTSQRRRHRAKINPANPYAAPEAEGGSLLKRLFGKKE